MVCVVLTGIPKPEAIKSVAAAPDSAPAGAADWRGVLTAVWLGGAGVLAAALLAGILFKIGSEIFVAAQHRTGLVIGMFFTYLIVKRLSPRYAVLAALVAWRTRSTLLTLVVVPSIYRWFDEEEVEA